MLKNITRLEHKVGERLYHFTCDPDSPLSHVKECLFQFLKYVGQLEDQAKANQPQVETPASSEEKEEPKE